MVSENKWSDRDVDELLTSFYQAEVPAQLNGPMPAAFRQAASPDTHATHAGTPQAVSSSSSRWITAAMIACAAALLMTVAAFRSGSDDASSGTLVNQPADTGTINVSDGSTDNSDFAAPEQNIEMLDDDADK